MGNLFDFLRRKKVEPRPLPIRDHVPAPPVAPSATHAGASAAPPTAARTDAADTPARSVEDLGLPAPMANALRTGLVRGAHAVLLDPEEFACMLCLLGDGTIDVAGECELETYEQSHRALQLVDGLRIAEQERTMHVQLYSTVTDLGRRMILQFFDPAWDEETAVERRKSNVRLINRLRPGTSLTRHNREVLLRALRRAGERPAPSFLQRLQREGLLADVDGDPEAVLGAAILPRKAAARVLGDYLGVPFVDIEESLPRAHCRLFTREQILEWEAIPCGEQGGSVLVAMADPTDNESVEKMKAHLGRDVILRVAAATDIRVAVDKLLKSP